MVGMLQRGEADLASRLTYTEIRSAAVDFSTTVWVNPGRYVS